MRFSSQSWMWAASGAWSSVEKNSLEVWRSEQARSSSPKTRARHSSAASAHERRLRTGFRSAYEILCAPFFARVVISRRASLLEVLENDGDAGRCVNECRRLCVDLAQHVTARRARELGVGKQRAGFREQRALVARGHHLGACV